MTASGISAAYLLLMVAIAVLVLWGRPWVSTWRSVVLALGLWVIIPASLAVLMSGLSRPMPTDQALFQDPDRSGELLWAGQLPPDSFWLLIEWPDDPTPRLYTMPWSDELAAQLEEMTAGLEEGERIGVLPFIVDHYDFDDAGDDPGVFHPLPQPSDPLKTSAPDSQPGET